MSYANPETRVGMSHAYSETKVAMSQPILKPGLQGHIQSWNHGRNVTSNPETRVAMSHPILKPGLQGHIQSWNQGRNVTSNPETRVAMSHCNPLKTLCKEIPWNIYLLSWYWAAIVRTKDAILKREYLLKRQLT